MGVRGNGRGRRWDGWDVETGGVSEVQGHVVHVMVQTRVPTSWARSGPYVPSETVQGGPWEEVRGTGGGWVGGKGEGRGREEERC